MLNPRVAGRYAKSLIDLANEKGQLEKIYADMQWLQAVCKASREFVTVLRSPVIKPDKKEKIVEAVTKVNVSEITSAFIRLMIRKSRENILPEVASAFIAQYKTFKNIYPVKLTTAVPVSEALKKEIIDHMKENSDMHTIELETAVDEKLIGGFVLQAGDKLIDGSVLYDLQTIARQFENNDFIYKVR